MRSAPAASSTRPVTRGAKAKQQSLSRPVTRASSRKAGRALEAEQHPAATVEPKSAPYQLRPRIDKRAKVQKAQKNDSKQGWSAKGPRDQRRQRRPAARSTNKLAPNATAVARLPKEARRTRRARARKSPSPKPESKHPRRVRAKRKAKVKKKAASKTSTISSWARGVSPGTPSEETERQLLEASGIRSLSSTQIEFSSTDQRSSTMAVTEKTSKTSKTSRTSKDSVTAKELAKRLLRRSVDLKERGDESWKPGRIFFNEEMQQSSVNERGSIFKNLKSVVTTLENFRQSKDQDYLLLDTVIKQLDQCKLIVHYPFAHHEYFQYLLDKCNSRNEAVLQRTIMMSIFHPYWLPDIYDWNAEEQWAEDNNASQFSEVSEGLPKKLPKPKPDLLFAFARDKLAGPNGRVNEVPHNLELAISPEGGDRAFPFLFVEVKRRSDSLEKAQLNNLNNAAQALYNIYRWFEQAKVVDTANAAQWDSDFREIRVFTFAFNALSLEVRLHRARRCEDGLVEFYFTKVFSTSSYDRDQLCNLFNNILKQYAESKLFKSLTKVYKTVTKEYKNSRKDHNAAAPGAHDAGNSRRSGGEQRNSKSGSKDGEAEVSHAQEREGEEEEEENDLQASQEGYLLSQAQESQISLRSQDTQTSPGSQQSRKRSRTTDATRGTKRQNQGKGKGK